MAILRIHARDNFVDRAKRKEVEIRKVTVRLQTIDAKERN